MQPTDVIWWYRFGSTLAQVMACCLTAPSHYLNGSRLIITQVLWHSTESNFTVSAPATILYNELENYTFKISAIQYIPRNMHTVFALLCFVVVIHWLIFPYPSGLLHWHCGNLTIAPVPAKQPWWIWINTSCEFIMNDCITTTKQSTTKPCAYFLGYTVSPRGQWVHMVPYIPIQLIWDQGPILLTFCCMDK